MYTRMRKKRAEDSSGGAEPFTAQAELSFNEAQYLVSLSFTYLSAVVARSVVSGGIRICWRAA